MNNEALRLADTLDFLGMDMQTPRLAAKELRRLHEVNQALIEALKCLTSQIFDQEIIIEWNDKQKALAALAKAGESNES